MSLFGWVSQLSGLSPSSSLAWVTTVTAAIIYIDKQARVDEWFRNIRFGADREKDNILISDLARAPYIVTDEGISAIHEGNPNSETYERVKLARRGRKTYYKIGF